MIRTSIRKILIFLLLSSALLTLCSANVLPERTYEFVTAHGNAQRLDIYCGKIGERPLNLIKDGYKISLGKTYITLEKSGEPLTISKYPGLKENINITAVFFCENSEYGTHTVFTLGGKEYINFTDFSKYKKRTEITVSVPKGQIVSVSASEIDYTPETKVYMHKTFSEPAYANRKVNWYRTDGVIKYYGDNPLNSGEKITYGGYYNPTLLDIGCTIYAERNGIILGFSKVPGKCAAYIRNENTAFANGKYEYITEPAPHSVYVPLRYTCDALKIKLSYTPKEIKLKLGKTSATLCETKNYALVGNKKITFPLAPVYIENNTAMVHKNVFSALGCNVYEDCGTVAISKDTDITRLGTFGTKSSLMKTVADANENLISPVTFIGKDSSLCGIVISDNVNTNAATAVYVNSTEKAKYLQKNLAADCAEIFVISKKPSCIQTLTKTNSLIHGVLDMCGETDEKKILNKTLSANCRTVLLDNANAAYYLSKFNVTVWTKPKTSADFYKALIKGANGIITDNPQKSAELMSIFTDPALLGKCVLYGHRGTTEYACENTLSAAEKAISAGADYIELDIWQTRDKNAVVMHDGTTGRMCGNDLVIKETTLDELKKLDINGEKILTLREYLGGLKKYENVVFNIEIKGGTTELAETTEQTLKDLDMIDRVHMSSFDTAVQKVLNVKMPYLAVTALSNDEYISAEQVYSAEYKTNSMLTGVREPALRSLKLRGERRNTVIDMDAEYKSLGKDFDSYMAYAKNIPHEISVQNDTPKVLNRFGDEISADVEKICSDGVTLYRCKTKRVNKSPYYIYGIE